MHYQYTRLTPCDTVSFVPFSAIHALFVSCAWRIFISRLTTVVVFFRATGTWSSSLSRLLFPGNGHSHTCTHFMCVCVCVLSNKNVICGLRCRCPSYTDSSRSCPLHMKLSLHYTFFYGSNRTIVNGMTNGPYKRFNSSRSENHHSVRKWIAPTRLIYSL